MTTVLEKADYTARCFVNGIIKNPKTGNWEPHSAHWGPVFKDHPLAQQSTAEGWAKELRSAIIMAARRKIASGEEYRNIEMLMPDMKWIENARSEAAKERAAKEWREKVVAEHGTLENFLERAARVNSALGVRRGIGAWKKVGDA